MLSVNFAGSEKSLVFRGNFVGDGRVASSHRAVGDICQGPVCPFLGCDPAGLAQVSKLPKCPKALKETVKGVSGLWSSVATIRVIGVNVFRVNGVNERNQKHSPVIAK